MALQINSTEQSPLFVSNTDIPLSSIYVRFKFIIHPSGKGVICNGIIYQNKSKYQSGSPVGANILTREIPVPIDVSGGEQADLSTIHTKLKTHYEGLGYTVSILDI